MTTTYSTRFGEICDARTHEVRDWDPRSVRPGLYGPDTRSWIEEMCARLAKRMPAGLDPDGRRLVDLAR